MSNYPTDLEIANAAYKKPIEEIDLKIIELGSKEGQKNNNKAEYYKKERDKILKKIYSNLNAWQKVQIARHPNRPHCLDYINAIFNVSRPAIINIFSSIMKWFS